MDARNAIAMCVQAAPASLRVAPTTVPLLRSARGLFPPRFRGFLAPKAGVVAVDATACLSARLGVDAPAAELLRKGLTPALQIGLAGVQAPAMPGFGSDADVDVRIGLMIVQHDEVLVIEPRRNFLAEANEAPVDAFLGIAFAEIGEQGSRDPNPSTETLQLPGVSLRRALLSRPS